MNDTLTAATGYVVPFHYLVLHEGGISKLVLGYAHFGMVAAARWIAKCATPYLTKAVYEYPAYGIKIVGNSLGGGVASLLTYILREHIEFSSSTCIVFSPASCMTWDLAESSKDFITTVINGSDIVPACSLASIDNLRSEVRASSWIRELWNKHTRFLNVVKHSVLSLRSCLPFLSCSRSVSSKPQVVKKSAQNGTQAAAKTRSCGSCCSCIGAHGCAIKICACPKECGQCNEAAGELDFGCSMGGEKCTVEESAESTRVSGGPMKEEEAEGNLKLELENEKAALKAVAEQKKEQPIEPAVLERHHYFPPGRIMHMVVMPATGTDRCGSIEDEQRVGIYETPRDLYGKIRLSPTMIEDHYMSSCKKTMELLIEELKKDEYGYTTL